MIQISDINAVIEATNLDVDTATLDPALALTDQGIDSLDFANVLFNLEETFNVKIKDEEIDRVSTINDMVAFLNAKAQ
ncbi:MAG: acyl carrier protein [Gammaproteobacteria bacterium]|nr:acyl carrier protein [Gammaproteobacteria bacterium]